MAGFGCCLSRHHLVLILLQVVSALSIIEETFVTCSRSTIDEVFVTCSPSISEELFVTCSLCIAEEKFGTCLAGSSYFFVAEDGNCVRFILDESYGLVKQLHLEKDKSCEEGNTSETFLTPESLVSKVALHP